MPLGFDREETIAREKGRPNFDPATMRPRALPDPWQVRHETGQTQTMERQPLTVRLEAGHGPVTHGSHRLEATTVAGTGARILSADGG